MNLAHIYRKRTSILGDVTEMFHYAMFDWRVVCIDPMNIYEFGVHQFVQTLFVFKQVAGCIAEVHTWQPLDERSYIIHWY